MLVPNYPFLLCASFIDFINKYYNIINMEVQDIQSNIALVREIASTPADKRVHHFCRLVHERLIAKSELPILQEVCSSTFELEEDGEYPQCRLLKGASISFGCAHKPEYWYAIQNTLTHLAQQDLPSDDLAEVQQMKEAVDRDYVHLHSRDGIDIQMADLKLQKGKPIDAGVAQTKKELGDQHSAMVQRMFDFSERIIALLDGVTERISS